MNLSKSTPFLAFLFYLFSSSSLSAQIDWVSATGLNLGDTFVDGAVYNNFAGTGLDVRINVNTVLGYPAISSSIPTIVEITGGADGASMTLTILNGTSDVVLRNHQNLLYRETITVSNPDAKNITVTEVSNNGGAAMTVDGIAMPTGGAPNAIIGDDSVVLTEGNNGAGTFHDVSMNDVNGFTWLYENTPGESGATEGFILTLSNISLPIELTSFDARPLSNNFVQLDWTTASETNNDYFTIERSQDGMNWEKVTEIDGKGTTLSKSTYSYIDREAYSKLSYYRLKQTDFDGQFSYSTIQSVYLENYDIIKIFPNPVLDFLTISNFDKKMKDLTILDVFGQPVNNLVSIRNIGESTYQVETSTLPIGIYFIKTPTSIRKFFKQ